MGHEHVRTVTTYNSKTLSMLATFKNTLFTNYAVLYCFTELCGNSCLLIVCSNIDLFIYLVAPCGTLGPTGMLGENKKHIHENGFFYHFHVGYHGNPGWCFVCHTSHINNPMTNKDFLPGLSAGCIIDISKNSALGPYCYATLL